MSVSGQTYLAGILQWIHLIAGALYFNAIASGAGLRAFVFLQKNEELQANERAERIIGFSLGIF